MNEFKTCNRCFDCNLLVEELRKVDPKAKILIGCQSMCAVGAKNPFVIVNGIPITASSVSEVIERVKECLN